MPIFAACFELETLMQRYIYNTLKHLWQTSLSEQAFNR